MAVITPYDFGAVGGGQPGDGIAFQNAINAIVPYETLFEIPADKFNLDGMEIVVPQDGVEIAGKGKYASYLINGGLRFQGSYVNARSFHMKNFSTQPLNGITLNGGSGRRHFTMSDIFIEDYDKLFRHDDGGSRGSATNCLFKGGTDSQVLLNAVDGTPSDVGDFSFGDCQFQPSQQFPKFCFRIHKFGTLMLSNCKIGGGLISNLYADPLNNDASVRQLFVSNCSIEGTNGTRDFPTVGFTDLGNGKVRVQTQSVHGLQDGMQHISISGTSHYDGRYIISGVTADTLEIETVWQGNDSGIVSAPNWDVDLTGVSAAQDNDINDCCFTGGDINYMRIGRASNVRVDCLVKHQFRIEPDAKNVLMMKSAFGRNAGIPAGNAEVTLQESADNWVEFSNSAGVPTMRSRNASIQIDDKGMLTGPKAFNGQEKTLSNNQAFEFIPPMDEGFIRISVEDYNHYLDVFFNASASYVNVISKSALFDVATVPLGGTTKAAGKCTFSAAGGKLYIENRLGPSCNFRYSITC